MVMQMLRNRAARLDETEKSGLRHASLPIVGVFGSGSNPHLEQSNELGSWLASLNVHLLTGGGGGVMLAVSRAFASTHNRAGLVIGIIPGQVNETGTEHGLRDGYPNPWIDIPIFTHLPDSGERGMHKTSRNHINVLTSDVIVVLPGQLGTASETELAVRYNKPVIAWLEDRSQIMGLHPGVPTVKRFSQIKKFVSANLPN